MLQRQESLHTILLSPTIQDRLASRGHHRITAYLFELTVDGAEIIVLGYSTVAFPEAARLSSAAAAGILLLRLGMQAHPTWECHLRLDARAVVEVVNVLQSDDQQPLVLHHLDYECGVIAVIAPAAGWGGGAAARAEVLAAEIAEAVGLAYHPEVQAREFLHPLVVVGLLLLLVEANIAQFGVLRRIPVLEAAVVLPPCAANALEERRVFFLVVDSVAARTARVGGHGGEPEPGREDGWGGRREPVLFSSVVNGREERLIAEMVWLIDR